MCVCVCVFGSGEEAPRGPEAASELEWNRRFDPRLEGGAVGPCGRRPGVRRARGPGNPPKPASGVAFSFLLGGGVGWGGVGWGGFLL